VTTSATPASTPAWRVLVPLSIGAVVSVGLGIYGREHQPSGETITTFGFADLISMKIWLATVVVALAVVQLLSALRMYGKLGRTPAPVWVAPLHRVSGALAVLVSLPVAYHCLWSLGYQDYDRRVMVHSVAGCLFYGAFVSKMLTLRWRRLPSWALPLFGGLVFTAVVVAWATSALWYFKTSGLPGGGGAGY
jgi:Family of unknown function (DUF6529)